MKFFKTQLIPLSFSAKVLRFVFYFVGKVSDAIFGKKFHYPLKGMQEDPLYFPSIETFYLGYKYFYRHLRLAEKDSGLENYFARQEFTPYRQQGNAQTMTFGVGGDLMPYELIHPRSAANYWSNAGDFLFGNDLNFANLETPVDLSKPYSAVEELMLGDVYFNANKEVFDLFNGSGQLRGFDVLGVANNHSIDCGVEGLENTLKFLGAKNILYTGAQVAESDYFKPLFVERNGIKLAIISCTYSLNDERLPHDKQWMVNHLRLNKPGVNIEKLVEASILARAGGADLVVYSLHCGNAYAAYPGAHIVDLFHRVFEQCGADIILGHHGHNPQPMESYTYTCPHTGKRKSGFAIYSLGDLMAYDYNFYCHFPIMLRFQLAKDDSGCGITKVQAYQGSIHLLYHPDKTDVRLLNLSKLAADKFEHAGLTSIGKKKAAILYDYHKEFLATMKGVEWVS